MIERSVIHWLWCIKEAFIACAILIKLDRFVRLDVWDVYQLSFTCKYGLMSLRTLFSRSMDEGASISHGQRMEGMISNATASFWCWRCKCAWEFQVIYSPKLFQHQKQSNQLQVKNLSRGKRVGRSTGTGRYSSVTKVHLFS